MPSPVLTCDLSTPCGATYPNPTGDALRILNFPSHLRPVHTLQCNTPESSRGRALHLEFSFWPVTRSQFTTGSATYPNPAGDALCIFNSPSDLRPVHTLPLTLTSARPPTRAWEVARTVVAPPSSVVKCLWEVFVWGVVLVVCVCVCVCHNCCSLSVCVCDPLIFLHPAVQHTQLQPETRFAF